MNYENPTKYLTVALCWEATLCAFQRCPFKCPCVFYVPDNKENSTFQPDKEGGLLLYLREDRWVRHPLKELPLQENMILLSQHLFRKWRGNLLSSLGGRPTGQQLPGPLACALLGRWIPTLASGAPAARWECLCGFQTQKAPKSHYWYHDTQTTRSTRNWEILTSVCCVALRKSLYLSISQALG